MPVVKGIDGSPQESPGRATGLLIRSVKSNKELLLTRVTEPRLAPDNERM